LLLKMKELNKLLMRLLACVIALAAFAHAVPVFAYNYAYGSGPESSSVFGKSTSDENLMVAANPDTMNIRRNKDAALWGPSYGVFSGDIPTDQTSLYHDNSSPYAGTGYPAQGGSAASAAAGYGGTTSASASAASGMAGLPAAQGAFSAVVGADMDGILPSTSVYTTGVLATAPSYFEDGSMGRLSIEKIGKTIKVYEGDSLENMKKGIGHFDYTSAWDGNVGFAGHNRGASAYFSFVKSLSTGDILTYSTPYGTRSYAIYSKEQISETDYSGLAWSAENILTLITCVEDVPPLRWCVQARQVS
jgi:sortase A